MAARRWKKCTFQGSKPAPSRMLFLKLLTAVHLRDIRVLPRKRCCSGRGVKNGPPDGKEDT
jgi:hypothetical protein